MAQAQGEPANATPSRSSWHGQKLRELTAMQPCPLYLVVMARASVPGWTVDAFIDDIDAASNKRCRKRSTAENPLCSPKHTQYTAFDRSLPRIFFFSIQHRIRDVERDHHFSSFSKTHTIYLHPAFDRTTSNPKHQTRLSLLAEDA